VGPQQLFGASPALRRLEVACWISCDFEARTKRGSCRCCQLTGIVAGVGDVAADPPPERHKVRIESRVLGHRCVLQLPQQPYTDARSGFLAHGRFRRAYVRLVQGTSAEVGRADTDTLALRSIVACEECPTKKPKPSGWVKVPGEIDPLCGCAADPRVWQN
jgi:hypothetical protein